MVALASWRTAAPLDRAELARAAVDLVLLVGLELDALAVLAVDQSLA